MRRWSAPIVYLLLAVLGHLPAFAALSTRAQNNPDAAQTDWFLGWTPWALTHGHSPLTSAHLAAPAGVNLMWNTLLPLPGLLAAPVTLTAGPVAAHTLLAVLGFAGSATSMWLAAGRWAPWLPARFAAGLLYGFSPYLVAQGSGHLNLTLVALPPLVLLLADEVLVRRRRPVLAGAALGLVALAQLLTTEEVLASTFVVAVFGAVLLAALHRPDRRALRRAGLGLAVAAGVVAVGAAYPLAVQFAGPLRITAPVQDPARYAADLLGSGVPTIFQVLGNRTAVTWGGNPSENGSYLGVPLLLVLAVLVWRLRAVPVVRFTAGLGLIAWVLSLGTRLHVGGHATSVPLPFALVAHVPVLHNLAAVRFSLYVMLCAALLLAVGLDRWRPRARVLLPLALLVVVPLVPNWPYGFGPAGTPAYFTTAAVDRVPAGALALTYPVPRFPNSYPMRWQAQADFRYRSVGGYLITPRPNGSGTFTGGQTLWERAVNPATVGRPVGGDLAALRGEIRDLGVRAVLVADRRGAEQVRALVARLLGRGPDEVTGGVAAWYLP